MVNTELGRKPRWECPCCGMIHDWDENAALNLLKLPLLAVAEDVMLLDGKELAGGDSTASEAAPGQGRTTPETAVNTQLRLAV